MKMKYYCSDRTCGGEDCKTCFPGNRDTSEDEEEPSAPTSDPEGAATPAEDAKRLADRIVKHVENGIVYEVGASHVSIVRDVFEKWIREAIEHHAIQQATWHCETLAKLEAASPSPTVEKLAQEIDDLYEAPSRIRPLRRILEREFGASQSVAEAAKEIMEHAWGAYSDIEIKTVIESILSRFREHELREAKQALEVLTQEREEFIRYCQSIQLAHGEVGPIKVARMHIERLVAELRELREECERLRKDKERLDWLETHKADVLFNDSLKHYSVSEKYKAWFRCRTLRPAIDAAMQPREETKP